MSASASPPSASAPHQLLSVGSTVKCFNGSSEQVEQSALFYLWRRCRVQAVEMDGDGRVARVNVSWDDLHDRDNEWISVGSNRLQLPDPARQQSPTDSAALAPATPPTLVAATNAADREKEETGNGTVVAAVSDADMTSFLAHVNDQLPASAPLAAAHSAASSPTSSKAAAVIAAQGFDTAFFASAAAAPHSASSSSSAATIADSQSRTRFPPPLPANYPPKLPASRPNASTSPPPTGALSTSPPQTRSTLHSVSHSSSTVPADHVSSATAASHPTAVAASPPHWEPGQLAPLSFDEFSALYRVDPDRYQIYQHQWQTEQQAHLHISSPSAQPPPPPPPHSAMPANNNNNNTAHPPPSALPIALHPSSHSAPTSRPTSRKSSVDSLPPAAAAVAAATVAVEHVSEFARDLARGSLVDVWNRKLHMWSNGEVVDVSQSVEKGAMVNILDYNTNMREWIRRASPRIAPPFTKSQEAAPSPPASPKLPTVQKRPAVVGDERSSMQKVGAALSNLSHQGSAALSTMAAALLPTSVAPPRSSSANGESSHLTFLSPKHSKASTGQSSHSFAAPTVVSVPTHTAPPVPATAPASTVPSSSSSSLPSSASSSSSSSFSSSSSSSSSAVAPSSAQPPSHVSQPPPAAAPGSLPDHPAGFAKTLTAGSSVDCYDTDQVWRIAEVTREAAEAVFVHYVGWTAKWDEWIPRDSRRIQPPRTFTVGDTGPKKPPVVEQPVAQPVQSFQPHPPAAAPVSQQRASARYECRRECKWKRVLSMGLGHREIQSLDVLFDRCCQLQDDYQEILLSAEPSKAALASFHAKMSAVSDEIARLRKSLPAFASFYLQQCSNIVSTVQSGIAEAEEALRRQLLAMQEEMYMSRLRRVFQLVEVPADGDCLYAAVGKGYAKAYELEVQHHQQHAKEKLPPKEPQPVPVNNAVPAPSTATEDSISETERAVAAGSSTTLSESHSSASASEMERPEAQPAAAEVGAGKEQRDAHDVAAHEQPAAQPGSFPLSDSTSSSDKPSPILSQPPPALSGRDLARHYRSKAVQQLLSTPSMHPLIRHEVHEALVQEREGHSDSTSKAIVSELNERYDSAADTGIPAEDGLRIYADVMARDGIYGTQLEVQALSKALHVPVHIYFRAGADDDEPMGTGGEEVKPTQIIGTEEEGTPISLAYYMGNRHYNLLLPRPPPPPLPAMPVPPPVAAAPLHSASAASSFSSDSLPSEQLMAVQENGAPLANPPLRRSVSGGHLIASGQPTAAASSNAAAAGGLHKHSGSKDELHLLSASSASKANSLLTSTKPISKPPTQPASSASTAVATPSHPPAQPSSHRDTHALSVLVVHPHMSSVPIRVPLHRNKPLLNLLYDFPTAASFTLRREKDGTQLSLDRTPDDYQLQEGETLTLFEPGEEPKRQRLETTTEQPAQAAAVATQSPPAAASLSAEDSVLVKSVVDGIVDAVVSRAPA